MMIDKVGATNQAQFINGERATAIASVLER